MAIMGKVMAISALPRPNPRQLEFMDMELAQFMHFGINTFWDAPLEYLEGHNPTFHNCYDMGSAVDHGNQTGSHYPCLDPRIFRPTDLDADDWMRNAKALGAKEICLTAAHEGGFALWPSNFTPYSVAASAWRGDVLREFADAANRWGIKICYYLQVADDGWGMYHRQPKYTAESFLAASLGKLREVLTHYGPVHRFWLDGNGFVPNYPPSLNNTELWVRVLEMIRSLSPATLVGPYKGDYCDSTDSSNRAVAHGKL